MTEIWPKILREDNIRVELLCPKHGVGHPSKALSKLHSALWNDSWMSSHGCCGCCFSQNAGFALSELHYAKSEYPT